MFLGLSPNFASNIKRIQVNLIRLNSRIIGMQEYRRSDWLMRSENLSYF